MKVRKDHGVSGFRFPDTYFTFDEGKPFAGSSLDFNSAFGTLVGAFSSGYKARQARKAEEYRVQSQHQQTMAAISQGLGHIPTVFGPYNTRSASSASYTGTAVGANGWVMPVAVIGGIGLLGLGFLAVMKD